MKVNFTSMNNNVMIGEMRVGDVFKATRKSRPSETALYMKVDGASGIIHQHACMCYAVNLASGQLREFSAGTRVEPIDAEVTCQ